MKRTIAILLLLLSSAAWAQEEVFEPDSVLVSGSVVNRMSGRPEPYTVVRLLQGDTVRVTAPCDSAGLFDAILVPEGRYLLEVQVHGRTLYQSDLVLQQDVDLSIGVITDTIRLVNLREVYVTGLRSELKSLLITSKEDPRLWDFCYRGSPWEIPRDGNAAVATPATLHPLYGDNPCSEGGSSCIRYVTKAKKFYNQSYGLTVNPYNSPMKNELLSEGRILDTHVPADSTQRKK